MWLQIEPRHYMLVTIKSILPKFFLNWNLTKSNFYITLGLVKKSLGKFAQSIAAWLLCSVLNFRRIPRLTQDRNYEKKQGFVRCQYAMDLVLICYIVMGPWKPYQSILPRWSIGFLLWGSYKKNYCIKTADSQMQAFLAACREIVSGGL